MKRSKINAIMKESILFINKMNFKLPPFAYWNLNDWKCKKEECREIFDNMLGWDITDFGSGDFSKVGLFLFTVRNGNLNDNKYKKSYAEKILVVDGKQVTPYHFHWNKMEDIINRGGGNLLVKLYNSSKEGKFLHTDVPVSMDGRNYTAKAGTTVKLTPGESITLPPGLYHQFQGEKSNEKILLGEVSQVNDDNTDNRFYNEAGRFPDIEEDREPLYLLYQDYNKFLNV